MSKGKRGGGEGGESSTCRVVFYYIGLTQSMVLLSRGTTHEVNVSLEGFLFMMPLLMGRLVFRLPRLRLNSIFYMRKDSVHLSVSNTLIWN